jgi:hypothetical protein
MASLHTVVVCTQRPYAQCWSGLSVLAWSVLLHNQDAKDHAVRGPDGDAHGLRSAPKCMPDQSGRMNPGFVFLFIFPEFEFAVTSRPDTPSPIHPTPDSGVRRPDLPHMYGDVLKIGEVPSADRAVCHGSHAACA